MESDGGASEKAKETQSKYPRKHIQMMLAS